MAKEVAAFIKLQIKGGAANPSPRWDQHWVQKESILWTSASSSMPEHKTRREKFFRSSSRFTATSRLTSS